MASNATIYKAVLQIADLDRQYFQDHALTLARHPSETEERMMVRVLAFALHAHEALSFGRGEEPRKASEDSVIPEPIVVRWSDLRDAPDRCAFRLLRRVYESFGYFENEMPIEFDRTTGELLLPG